MAHVSKRSIDMKPIENDEKALVFKGGSQRSGYKHSTFYMVKLFYVPDLDTPYIVQKTSILGSGGKAFQRLDEALDRINWLIDTEEGGFKKKRIQDKYDVPDYVIEDVK